MYGMPPAYHTRRSYVIMCEAFCGRPRQTLQASAWPHSLGVRETSSRGDIRTEYQRATVAQRVSVLISPLDDVSQKVDFEDRHSQFTVSERSIPGSACLCFDCWLPGGSAGRRVPQPAAVPGVVVAPAQLLGQSCLSRHWPCSAPRVTRSAQGGTCAAQSATGTQDGCTRSASSFHVSLAKSQPEHSQREVTVADTAPRWHGRRRRYPGARGLADVHQPVRRRRLHGGARCVRWLYIL